MSEQITELQLAEILVEALDLEDLEASEIPVEADLFGTQDPEGLGLDSIDALEISLAVAQNFGVQLKADDENNQQIFANLKSLTAHINQQRK